jgi:NAD-dependent SIR2 family protein deacetylase
MSLPLAVGADRDTSLTSLHEFVLRHPRLFVLSGAGISTDSGIPGYRDADGRWNRAPPTLFQDFVRSEWVRQRYWARSMAGWPIIARARPNAAHCALAHLAATGQVRQLVTQNVDGLHQRAGNENVIELHGNLEGVECLRCGALHSRASIQHALEAENPQFHVVGVEAAADGDASVERDDFSGFHVPECAYCGGVLKPNVVFFGESVPKNRVEAAQKALEQADAMLVVGSSLMVYSGYRFCEWAEKLGKPIAAINLGKTRADHLYALKVESSCASALTALVERLALHS